MAPTRNVEDSKYYCFCGRVHVKDLANGIAWFRIDVSTITLCYIILEQILGILFSKNSDEARSIFVIALIFIVPEALICLISAILVIYGSRKKKPGAYLPFLIFEGLRIAICLGNFIVIVINGIALHVLHKGHNELDLEFNPESYKTSHDSIFHSPNNEPFFFLTSTIPAPKFQLNEQSFVAPLLIPILITIGFLIGFLIFAWVVTYRAYKYTKEITANQPMVAMEESRTLILPPKA